MENDEALSGATAGERYYGHLTMADGSRKILTSDEAKALHEELVAARAATEAKLPDEKTTLHAMNEAFHRLRDFGWSEAVYCPKDGSEFEAIEAGSTGIHRCIYMGEWPNGSWWIVGDGDMSPSRPVLYRLLPADEAKRQERMRAAAERFRAERLATGNPEP